MIIDIHTHIFPDALAQRAVHMLAERSRVRAWLDGTAGGLFNSMQSAGVDISAIMHIATKPSQSRTINSWALSLKETHPSFVNFGTVHPAQEDWQDEIAWLSEHNFAGIKFHPDYQEFFVDDSAIYPIYKALSDAGLVVLFHAGVDIGLPPPVHCTPERLARTLDAFPKMKTIAAHMGGYTMWEDVEHYLVGRDLYFDTSYSITDLGFTAMRHLVLAHGSHRILFGTDSPWTDQAEEIAAIRKLDLSPEDIDGILGDNAAKLLGLSEM